MKSSHLLTPFRLSLILLAIVGIGFWQVWVIPTTSYQVAAIGPSTMPLAVVILLALLSLGYGLSALRGGQTEVSDSMEGDPLPQANLRFVSLLGGSLLFMLLISWLGFFIAAFLIGMGTSFAFDASLKHIKTWVINALIAALVWVLFVKVLSVDIGPLFSLSLGK